MNIRVLKKGKLKWQFVLGGASIAFANALRRIMISEIPVLSIDWLEIHDNTSSVFDEMIAQRLGLIPLVFDPSKFNLTDECKCKNKGCPSCQVVFALEKTGAGIVYSKDMKSSNKTVKPTDPGFMLLELLGDQKVKLEAIARLGTGKEHAKFQAANAVYQNYPERVGEKMNENPEKFLFTVETISGLSPEYIVNKAAEILESKAKDFKKEATKL